MALAGLVFQILLTVFLIILWSYSQSESILAVLRLSGAGVLIWTALLLVYHQRKLVQDEDFETDQLRREDRGLGGDALFDTQGERLLLARRRLHWMYRWILPIFTVITFGALLANGLAGWSWSLRESFRSTSWPEIRNLQQSGSLLIAFLGGAAFLSFLLSRYVVGMARHREWHMLRAGSSFLMGITLSLVATAAVLAVQVATGNAVPEHVLAFVLRILLLVLAVEFALNFVLDFYRPRSPGEEPRPSFDSRFLGLFSEPGGIARSIAEAINYQFGFDVSSTWFYQLLQRSVVPLIGFAVLTLFAASCLVFVGTGEQAVIEHYGKPKHITMADGKEVVSTLGPGLHFKWPWPIDVAHKVAVDRIHELKIGIEDKSEEGEQEELILWTNKHSREPHLLVLLATPELIEHFDKNQKESDTRPAADAAPAPAAVATAQTQPADRREAKAVPVSILRVAASIQYKVRDAWAWLTEYEEPEKMLEAIANREIVRHCASADVMGLMGTDRGRIEKAIWGSIQESADEVGLGVEIKFFGLQGAHPPQELAEDFQKVIGAEHEKIASINSARAEANKALTESAGDVDKARMLAEAIATMNGLEHDPAATEPQRVAAREKVRVLFVGKAEERVNPIGGQAAVRVAAARARRWQLENEAGAKAVAFEQDIATMKAAPNVFKMRKYLETLAGSMGKARKYIIASQGQYELPMFQINLQDPLNAPLDIATEEKKP